MSILPPPVDPTEVVAQTTPTVGRPRAPWETGNVSNIVSSSYLYENFNITATNLVTMDTWLNIINKSGDFQGGGVRKYWKK